MSKQRAHFHTYEYPRPAVTVDIAIFTVKDGLLQVLLIKRKNDPFKGCLALPGGFVDKDESLDIAAHRELLEETGVGDESGNYLFLEQIGAFGDPGRDPRGHTVSVVYMAMVSGDKEIRAGDDATGAEWVKAYLLDSGKNGEICRMAFDHRKVLEFALGKLRAKLNFLKRAVVLPVGLEVLPKQFTIQQLQRVYETILCKKLENAFFRKRIMEMGVVFKPDHPETPWSYEFRRDAVRGEWACRE